MQNRIDKLSTIDTDFNFQTTKTIKLLLFTVFF
jgi:hypothetical protein